MSENLFEEYVNGLDAEEEKPFNRLKDIEIETWDGKIIKTWNSGGDSSGDPDRWNDDTDTIREAYAGLMSFVMSAMPTPVWVRVCADCGGFFISQNWRAEHCDECGGEE